MSNAGGGNLAFVICQPRKDGKKQRPTKAARSHAATVGYCRSAQAAFEARQELVDRTRQGVDWPPRLADGSSHTRSLCQPQGKAGTTTISVSEQPPPESGNAVSDVAAYVDQNGRALTFPPSRAVSPNFGAVEISTFDVTDTVSAHLVSFITNVIWPVVGCDKAHRRWFDDLCTSPVLFHVHCTTASMYLGILDNQLQYVNNRRALAHKTKAMSAMRETIDNIASMSQQAKEGLILAMLILSSHEVELRGYENHELPFVPHVDTVKWFRWWGRAECGQPHERAAFLLIGQLGGLHALETPGLAHIAALVDIARRSSTSHLSKPLYECYWQGYASELLPDFIRPEARTAAHSGSNTILNPGLGFTQLPGRLPKQAVSVFLELACLDQIMSHAQDNPPGDSDFERLMDASRATVHRLTALPAWENLPATEQGSSTRLVYELCHLTCLIYSNAVLFPLPPHSGWNMRHTSYVRQIYKEEDLQNVGEAVEPFWLWVLVVSGIASYRTPNRTYFEGALRRYLERRPVSHDQAVLELGDFIWSEPACPKGFVKPQDVSPTRQSFSSKGPPVTWVS
ncbi:putative fungal transcription factor [Septoria linicola]|nr:putative fungal transcription factor [Septoria linicola]